MRQVEYIWRCFVFVGWMTKLLAPRNDVIAVLTNLGEPLPVGLD